MFNHLNATFTSGVIIEYGEVWLRITIVAFLSIILVCFDWGIIGHSVTHVPDVIAYLTNADHTAIHIIKHLIDNLQEVVNLILAGEVAEAAVKYLISQLCILVCRHIRILYFYLQN